MVRKRMVWLALGGSALLLAVVAVAGCAGGADKQPAVPPQTAPTPADTSIAPTAESSFPARSVQPDESATLQDSVEAVPTSGANVERHHIQDSVDIVIRDSSGRIKDEQTAR